MNDDGIALIAAERRRQVEVEHWTAEHDAMHAAGELSMAAACYAADEPIYVKREACSEGRADMPSVTFADPWPWKARWYKRGDRIRDLIKAGALIAAEIDKMLSEAEAMAPEAETPPAEWHGSAKDVGGLLSADTSERRVRQIGEKLIAQKRAEEARKETEPTPEEIIQRVENQSVPADVDIECIRDLIGLAKRLLSAKRNREKQAEYIVRHWGSPTVEVPRTPIPVQDQARKEK